MKYFLFVCCLVALSRVAFADEAFSTFVAGQGATGSITGTELMPVIQGGVTTKDTLSGLKSYFGGLVGMTGGQIPVAATSTTVTSSVPQTTWLFAGSGNSTLVGSGARCLHADATGTVTAASGDCATGGSGSVTSITLSSPGGIFSVTGTNPITTSGTFGYSMTGTSGGIPYFSSASVLSSSAALTANLPLIGGGAGSAPSVGTRSGNTTQFVTTTGAQTSGNCVSIDASGNHIAAGVACGGGVPNTTVLTPVAGDNAPQLTTALSTFNTVILSPGTYEVCSQVEVPTHKTLMGMDGVKEGVGNLTPSFHGATQVNTSGCSGVSGEGGFTAGQGIFHTHDGTTLSGFTITGNFWLNNASVLKCVNAQNSMGLVIDGMQIDACAIGVDRRSSSVSGDNGSISQDAVIVHSTFNYNNIAIHCGTDSGGSGCADERYDGLECEVPGGGSLSGSATCIEVDGGIHIQILNSRMEDASTAITLNGAAYVLVNNNLFNRIGAISIQGGSFQIDFVGNKASGKVGEGGCPVMSCFQYGVVLQGNPGSINISNNIFPYGYTSAFQSTSTRMFVSSVHGNVAGVPLYADNHTASVILHSTPALMNRDSALDVGESGMETGSGSHATLTTLTAPGPSGDTVAARITEDSTATVLHFAQINGTYTLTSGNTYTYKAFFAPGSSGTRNISLDMGGAGGNSVGVVFNPSTCAFVTSSHSGAGTIVGTPTAFPIGAGWCEGVIAFTGISSATPLLYLVSGSTFTYTGDGASNVLAFNPDILDGAISPLVSFQP